LQLTTGRGGLDFEGIGYRASTYKANAALVSAVASARAWENDGRSAVIGKAVTITGDGEVGFGSEGDPLLGKINQYEFDGYVTVQDAGYTEFDGVSGSLPDAGDYLVVDGNGAVKASTGATGPAKAVSVDDDNQKVMVLIC
jgi:hypothetical protein